MFPTPSPRPRHRAVLCTAAVALAALALSAAVFAVSGTAAFAGKPETVAVELVAPPFVHAHEQVATHPPRIVQFRMVIEEKQMVVDREGTVLHAMTFNGSMPAPLMVVHEGDDVELTLVNPASNEMPHNIDFHASTGAMGGGELTKINPGEEVVLRWKATRPGVFVYHCAPEGMIAWHVVSGMSGAVMVLPRDGLKDHAGKAVRYDKVFYIGENDLYIPRKADKTFASYATAGESYADTIETMKGLIPSHVVFNGAVGALTGDKAMTAKVGDKVLFIHTTANRDTRPHLIGGHGDLVWPGGSFNNAPMRDLETWFIPGGSAAAMFYTFRQPGLYAYVNHNLIEAELLGASAHIKVEGTWNDDLMKQVVAPRPISD